MGFTIREVLSETASQYKVELIAGGRGDQRIISWVHVIEDATIIQNFWGNELAVTLGIGFPTEESLLHIIELLIRHRSSGLIINTGKYITEISPRIKDYCEEHGFPLMTVPWEIYVADMVKDFCIRIFESEQNEKMYAKAFLAILQNRDNRENARKILANAYEIEEMFQIAVIYINPRIKRDLMFVRKAESRVRTLLDRLGYSYSFFEEETHFILVVNKITQKEIHKILERIVQQYRKKQQEEAVFVGIGTKAENIEQLHISFIKARAAMRMAVYMKKAVVYYEDMGVSSIIFTVEDDDILREYYNKTLSVLLQYDEKHQSNYVETLENYLQYNGSIQAIAQAMFTHRNTVNYRIHKIYELLGSELKTTSERFPYEMAFYIKKVIPMKNDEKHS